MLTTANRLKTHRIMKPLTGKLARVLSRTLAICVLVLLTSNAMAAGKINTLEKSGLFGKYKESGIAIRGFDTVAYFTVGKPVKGNENYSVEWSDATWLFSSQEHADLFKNDPKAYAPQYGGYCAYGVAQDALVKIEGDQWKIENNKLYLNYDERFQNKWLKNISGYIKTADEKFSSLLDAS